jgi:hypothetical protein
LCYDAKALAASKDTPHFGTAAVAQRSDQAVAANFATHGLVQAQRAQRRAGASAKRSQLGVCHTHGAALEVQLGPQRRRTRRSMPRFARARGARARVQLKPRQHHGRDDLVKKAGDALAQGLLFAARVLEQLLQFSTSGIHGSVGGRDADVATIDGLALQQ